ncbi:hypothetical protein [Pseudomonas indica]|uniref:hypothetical protein n=1 Tax=Pseudomonas indica TaxID=137658 RepID=UPI003FD46595
MSDATIHLRIPSATKGRWVRASRAAGLRLTDYITSAVEAYMQQQLAQVAIPAGVTFADLRLQRDADGGVSFDWGVIERICRESSLPVELLRDAPEDNVAGLIIAWYRAHLQQGGQPDPVAEDLIGEVIAEERAGQSTSHAPGRA